MKKGKWYLLLGIIIVLSLGGSALYLIQSYMIFCNNGEFVTNDTLINLTIGSTTLNIDLSSTDNNTFELLEAVTEVPLPVYFEGSKNLEVAINNVPIDSSDQLVIDEIGKESYLSLHISNDNLSRDFRIRTLPEDFPDIHLTGKASYNGDFYGDLAASAENQNYYIFKMAPSGELKYVKSSPYVIRNFRKWEIDGKNYYSYFQEFPEYSNIASGGYCSGYYIVMNENFDTIDSVGIQPSENKKIGTTEYAEQHEFIMLGVNHYISTAYIVKNPINSHCKGSLTPGTRILAGYLQEVKDGQVIWDWISTDYPEFYDGYVESDNFQNVDYMHAIDYFHLNSVYIDPKDNNIILSARNQDAIIKISREDGHIIWILGGKNDQFRLSDNQKFSRQHFATYVQNGNLLLFDNGFDSELSRVLEISLDEENKTIKNYNEYSLGIFGKWCGSVQKLEPDKSVYCIGWGIKVNSYSLMSLVNFSDAQVICELISKTTDLSSYRICFY